MSALCESIETAVADAVDASVHETFSMMIGQDITLTHKGCVSQSLELSSNRRNPHPADDQVTVIVGLSGDLQGSVCTCLDRAAALDWTKRLIDHETDEVDQTVVDAIGELGNMLVGSAKGRLQDCSLKLGLPSVLMTGRSHLAFPTRCRPVEMRYAYGNWEMDVFIALTHAAN